MRVNQYILLMLTFLVSVSMRGQYNPTNPAEPSAFYTLTLQADPVGGGSFNISTTTTRTEGEKVSLRATPNTYYEFVSWELDGEVLSTASSYTYTMPAQNVTLIAHYRYNPSYDPSNPSEPSEPNLPVYSTLYLECSPAEGGSINIASGTRYVVGASVSLRATANSAAYYKFLNWTENGDVISTSSSFNYVMKAGNPRLVANFEYDPSYDPSNPSEPSEAEFYHRLYLKSNPSNGGYFNISSGNQYKEGSGVRLVAYSNQYFTFESWTLDGSVISTANSFNYVMPETDVTLTANYSYQTVTPDDPEGWNDLSIPHLLSYEGIYTETTDGIVEYMVENDGNWMPLTETLKPGEAYAANFVVIFNSSKKVHEIKFRTKDQAGTLKEFHLMQYLDVNLHSLSDIETKTYTGDSLYQTNLTSEIGLDHIVIDNYQNNVNVGTASFRVNGLYPYSIGRKTYTFKIDPQSLSGELELGVTEFVYNGQPFTPVWKFTNENYVNLEASKDYTISWSNNTLPGTAMLTVRGKGNYTGELTAHFTIDKAQLTDDLYTLTLPDENITYDEQSHGAFITTAEGVGKATISYLKQGETALTTTPPTEAGDYTIYLEFADGTLYYGRERTQVGTFSIYQFSAEEWAILQSVLLQLTEMDWAQSWDESQGMKGLSSLQGLTVEKGHVTKLDLSGQNLTGAFPYFILALPQLVSVNLADNHLTGDIGTATYAFAQQNPTLMEHLQDINISGNQFSGNIGVFANCFTSLTSLDASDNCLEDVFPVIPSTVATLDISKQTISRVVPLHLSSLSADSIATKVPSILLYDHANQTFVTDINLLCTTPDDSWGMTLSYQDGELTIPYVSEQNTYYGESGDTLNVTVVDNNGTREGSTFKITMLFDQGDANFVNGVDATDLQATILYAFGGYRNQPFNHTAADTYKDFNINVQDVICTVNILLEDVSVTQNNSVSQARSSVSDAFGGEQNYIYKKGNQIFLHSNTPIASMSIKAAGHINWNVEKYGMMQSVRNSNMVSYSLNGMTLPAYEDIVIGESDDNVTIYAVSMSDIEASPIKVIIYDDVPTSIDSINVNDNRIEIYDVSGMQRNTLTKGLNIIKHNGKATKLYNK